MVLLSPIFNLIRCVCIIISNCPSNLFRDSMSLIDFFFVQFTAASSSTLPSFFGEIGCVSGVVSTTLTFFSFPCKLHFSHNELLIIFVYSIKTEKILGTLSTFAKYTHQSIIHHPPPPSINPIKHQPTTDRPIDHPVTFLNSRAKFTFSQKCPPIPWNAKDQRHEAVHRLLCLRVGHPSRPDHADSPYR